MKKECACSSSPTLIFACSGAADVGEISDRAARKLSSAGFGKMYCLTGVGGRVSGIMASTEAASNILAIDGCSLDCAKKTLEEGGFTRFTHLRITDLGFTKGSSPATEEAVSNVVARGQELLSCGDAGK